MASGQKHLLLASQVIATDTTTLGSAVQIDRRNIGLIGLIEVSSRTDGTYTLSIEESHDGVSWAPVVLAAATAISADGIGLAKVDKITPHLVYIRASVLSASVTTGATVEVNLLTEDKS